MRGIGVLSIARKVLGVGTGENVNALCYKWDWGGRANFEVNWVIIGKVIEKTITWTLK